MLIYVSSFAQTHDKYVGNYSDESGQSITLRGDNTFGYSSQVHGSKSWAIGTWKTVSDTVYLNQTIIYDTVKTSASEYYLIESNDTKRDVILKEHLGMTALGSNQITSKLPALYFKRGRLYIVAVDGRLIKPKGIGLDGKKHRMWYKKNRA
ncbi:hypothetical protein IM792_08775 [Mucilaginibacter sp. JRF]|uniref:hypothetical protein n=1 Tax=Mucilaginibacter sp. JRF TaxID=2780088 RepID=UPI0018819AED|nr:hypothetical protein [Mucilaginibacter sp. JRF]MBE9584538.1 hypothetical protein [Mucilaginibacter sp. JRF]